MKLEPWQKTLSLLTVVLVAGFIAGVWWPVDAQRRALQAKIDDARNQIEANRQNAQRLPKMAATRRSLIRTIDEITCPVAGADERVRLLHAFTQKIETRQLSDADIQTRPVKTGEDFSVTRIRLSFNGKFDEAFGLLQDIESLDRVVRSSRINLSRDVATQIQPDEPEPLEVVIELATYFTPEEAS